MKILFLTDGIHPFQLGGMQKHSLILSRLLAERDIWMHLYHPGGKEYSKENFRAQYGAEISYITEKVIPWPESNRQLPGHYIKENKLYSELIYNDVRDNIHEFDLIYAQGFTGWYFIQEREKGYVHIPVLVNFHGFEMFQKAPNIKVWLEYELFKRAVKFNSIHADGVFSFGGQIDKILIKMGVPKDRILRQSNGIEERWLIKDYEIQKKTDRVVLTFIGRNERRKGIHELNKVLRNLLTKDNLEFEFNFIGPLPASIQIDDSRIKYLGEIRDAEAIKTILRRSDCLVCPSHSEGMPTVILEAMASGLAIIATDVGAVSRMIDNNGLLLEKPNPALIESALIKLIEMDADKLQQMKQRSVELVRDLFIWDVIADQKIQQFKELLDTH